MTVYNFSDITIPNTNRAVAFAVNAKGQVVGASADTTGTTESGFLYDGGALTTIAIPGASSTEAVAINASGAILLNYETGTSPNTVDGSAVDVGGSFQTISIPGSTGTMGAGINASGQVAGYYYDNANVRHGFLDVNGKITVIDPGSSKGTTVSAINDPGEVVGYYQDNTGADRGFVYVAGSFVSLDVPGATGTEATAINASGQVAGTYTDATGVHGFVTKDSSIYSPDFTTFDVPGAAQIDVAGINASGTVGGYFIDANGKVFGFTEQNGLVSVVDDPKHQNEGYFAINDAGELVGTGVDNSLETAIIANLAPPAIAGTMADQAATGTNPIAPFASATVTDPNNGVETLTISLSGGAGTLSGAGLAANADGTYTLQGSAADVTKQLEALQFTPAGQSATTRFALSDATSLGTSATDSTTTVVDTGAAPPPPPPSQDAVSLDTAVSYYRGVFTITGTATSAAGGGSVEISATRDDGIVDLGSAAVNADGTFSFEDRVGRNTQIFIGATLTDGAGGTASTQSHYGLIGGLKPRGGGGEQQRYSADDAVETASISFRPNGSQTVQVEAGGQTFASAFSDTFENNSAPNTTFVFDPGYGADVVDQFRVGRAGHDTLSFAGADFGTSRASQLASVLANTSNTQQGALITDPASGDTVLLTGVTKGQLAANKGDFAFHA